MSGSILLWSRNPRSDIRFERKLSREVFSGCTPRIAPIEVSLSDPVGEAWRDMLWLLRCSTRLGL